jgi:bisphosphoglycerate-independent phosphoglycerate mutase (AlkP superfamily)
LEQLDHANSLLMLVSDHGNLEDWTTSKHTTNPSLTLLVGAGFQKLIPHLHSLADVKPAILTYLFE